MSWPLFWLTIVTSSRLILCPPLWWWLWRRHGAWVLAARCALIAWFGLTDYCDGDYARAHGLETPWGGWVDHLADWAFGLTVLGLAIRDSSFPKKRPARRPPSGPPE
jgi:phosphatidylglycerophosphate synthase